MKRNDSFTLTNISGVDYILPFGQMIADHRRGIRTNSTGVFLWETLAQEISRDALIRRCMAYFHAEEGERELLVRDIEEFLSVLYAYGMLDDTSRLDAEKPIGLFRIAGLTLALNGEADCISENFEPFRIPMSQEGIPLPAADQTINIRIRLPENHINGTLLLRNPELNIIDAGNRYIFTFPTFRNILEASLTKDGSAADFYCRPEKDEESKDNLFHAVRTVFLYLAWLHDMAVIHSASFLYREHIWLFSGHSGMGKSTHTNLWHDLVGVPIINGDLNLFTMENGHPVVKGIPWCGTSGICDTHTYPLGGIILLNQASEDEVVELSADEKRLLVSQRLISPAWTENMFRKELELVDGIADHILICKLRCTKNPSAVEVMKKYIDENF